MTPTTAYDVMVLLKEAVRDDDPVLILSSVKKTGRVVIVEIGLQIAERIPDYLLAPIARIAATNTPAPFSPVMEKFYISQPERIAETIRLMMAEY